ncbi:hypothetical protein [Sphingomonas paucimobilis]|jgi:hypothetical protein|uniref:Uncharacterized protein n=1 Tax=Sphingomonas paucimobilis TaxID=13689 RepID=A0A7T3ADB9_SPHPI|nr:hypothetical protein [Sphingomonas paucimobilis]QPT09858.1 hypothetical protein I6G38_06350 [Sphingomonas paucimobilis]
MTFWEFLHRLGPGYPSARGWYAVGLFTLTLVILGMIAAFPELRRDEFFKSISTAIVVTGYIGFAVGLRDPAKDREQIGTLLSGLNAAVDRIPPRG